MKKKHNSRNIQHLEKLNNLSKDVLLSARYVHENTNNNHENMNIPISFDLSKTKTDLLNPLFKQKLFEIVSEISSRNKTISPTYNRTPTYNNGSYTSRNSNIDYSKSPILSDEKREVLNMKKNEILYLLNPFNSKFNKGKNKHVKHININSLYKKNEIKFSDKIRKEINRILSKNEFSGNTIQIGERKKIDIPKLNLKTSHKRNYTSIFP
jgi:hypothetical protein